MILEEDERDTLRWGQWGQVGIFLLKDQHSSLPQISVPISGPACGHDPLHPAVLKVRSVGVPPIQISLSSTRWPLEHLCPSWFLGKFWFLA